MHTRTRVASDHALIAPDSHVVAPIFGWTATEGVMLISPAMGSTPRGPRFAMYLATLTSDSRSDGCRNQRFVVVLDGELTLDDQTLGPDAFAYLPAGADCRLKSSTHAKVLVFEKPYIECPGTPPPAMRTGQLADVESEPFMGDPDAQLTTLLPIQPAFDMAVNVFTFQPGTPLPLVETHIMEHGLFMASGRGIYRLGESWYPVEAGDAIYMAAYCPQWFAAIGKTPATYIYYKDVHRSPFPTA